MTGTSIEERAQDSCFQLLGWVLVVPVGIVLYFVFAHSADGILGSMYNRLPECHAERVEFPVDKVWTETHGGLFYTTTDYFASVNGKTYVLTQAEYGRWSAGDRVGGVFTHCWGLVTGNTDFFTPEW